MERLTRLLGIGLLVALAALSIANFQDTLDAADDDTVARRTAPSEEETDEQSDEQGAPPAYLSFRTGVRSGLYDVGDLPGADDENADEDENSSEDESSGEDEESGESSERGGIRSLNDDGEIVPGLYATAFGVEDCTFELRRVMRNKTEAVIGADRLKQGRMLVSINEIEPDTFRASRECGDWIPWSPLVEPLVVAGDGDYWIGDLKRGTWDVPADCMWEKVVGFRGAKLWDVQDSGFGPDEPLIVDDETIGVRIRGCHSDFVHASVR